VSQMDVNSLRKIYISLKRLRLGFRVVGYKPNI